MMGVPVQDTTSREEETNEDEKTGILSHSLESR